MAIDAEEAARTRLARDGGSPARTRPPQPMYPVEAVAGV
jgi:hypothetical protein